MILKELNNAFILDKPAGVSTHTPDGGVTPGFLEMASQLLDRPLWAVHRLDSGTSGCLLVTTVASNVDLWTHILAQRQKKIYFHLAKLLPRFGLGPRRSHRKNGFPSVWFGQR